MRQVANLNQAGASPAHRSNYMYDQSVLIINENYQNTFPHIVEIPFDESKYWEVMHWCIKHVGSSHANWEHYGLTLADLRDMKHVFEFRNESDAVAFNLTWS